jgi:hypothetical protein
MAHRPTTANELEKLTRVRIDTPNTGGAGGTAFLYKTTAAAGGLTLGRY